MAKSKARPQAEQHYESQRKRRGRGKVKMQPPLTPMIDVTFLLLIFFVLTARFQNEGSIPGSIAEGSMGQRPLPSDLVPVSVTVSQEGSGEESTPIYSVGLNDENILKAPRDLSVGEYRQRMAELLQAELKRLRAAHPDPPNEKIPVIIKVEKGYGTLSPGAAGYVRWQYWLEAFNQAMAAGFERIKLQVST